MCTITYFPLKNNSFIVTHTRDEAINRVAIPPAYYEELNTQLYYAKDLQAGGTWMGVSAKNNLVCIMNGAFRQHQRRLVYRKSRGIVVKELLADEKITEAIQKYDFQGIEQFFILLFSWNQEKQLQIQELIWDGETYHLQSIPTDQPQIWSSAMLYEEEQRIFREKVFAEFVQEQKEITAEDLRNFHLLTTIQGKEGITINRGFLKTTSLSQLIFMGNKKQYFFRDLQDDFIQTEEVKF